ncbi:MAG TPA: GNAT family protein [Candidatus Thermoplasmatota archaeon]|nr:GNAT family protein [Candidatus Thermoplasmatota archaeon]
MAASTTAKGTPQPMPAASPVTLRGDHVVLEPLRTEHAQELWPAASERDLWAYMAYDVAGVEDLRRWIADRAAPQARGEALPFLLRDARTGEAFGSSSLFDINAAFHTLELGHTWVGASHRRTAANTEAKLLLLGHAFVTLGAIRVQLKCDARNLRSAAAIERIGAVREGVIRHQRLLPDGHKRSAVVFSITDDEWPAVQARLSSRLAR